ncbi:MAG: hypothetical protein AAF383_01500 [Cyanobacteria bacterium P01_A01_bin.83]
MLLNQLDYALGRWGYSSRCHSDRIYLFKVFIQQAIAHILKDNY